MLLAGVFSTGRRNDLKIIAHRRIERLIISPLARYGSFFGEGGSPPLSLSRSLLLPSPPRAVGVKCGRKVAEISGQQPFSFEYMQIFGDFEDFFKIVLSLYNK